MPTITIIMPGPSDAAINKARRCACAGRKPYSRPSDEHKRWMAEAIKRVRLTVEADEWQTCETECHVEMHCVWPRVHRSGSSSGLALGDVDAPVKSVLDALTRGRAVWDDSLVTRVESVKRHALPDEQPKIIVTVETLP